MFPHCKKTSILSAILVILLSVSTAAQTISQWPDEQECIVNPPDEPVRSGWCLSILRNKGNCVSCHALNVSPWPETLPTAGNIAPPLVAILLRFPDAEALRQQVADAPMLNPNSSMPPYERHELLSKEEIDHILAFLKTL